MPTGMRCEATATRAGPRPRATLPWASSSTSPRTGRGRTPKGPRLGGAGEPRWTEVWSHIALGKIFDITGQRDRAVNEYRLAVQTNDNTQGAVNEARQYLQKPYLRPNND